MQALVPRSNDAHPFLFSVREEVRSPSLGKASLQWLQRRALLDLETHVVVKRTVTVGSDRAVLFGIMQIVTSSVRDVCA